MPTDDPAFARLPDPPYYAVIFTTRRTEGDHGYAEMAEKLEILAREQPGFLGIESVRGADKTGITVSYWQNEDAIRAWKKNADHAAARALGRERWYAHYELKVAKVERAYALTSQQT